MTAHTVAMQLLDKRLDVLERVGGRREREVTEVLRCGRLGLYDYTVHGMHKEKVCVTVSAYGAC